MISTKFKDISLVLMFVTALGLLSACSNTFDGAGQDIEHAGEEIQDAAD